MFYIFQSGKIIQFLVARALGLEAYFKKGKLGRFFCMTFLFIHYQMSMMCVVLTVAQLCQDQQLGQHISTGILVTFLLNTFEFG